VEKCLKTRYANIDDSKLIHELSKQLGYNSSISHIESRIEELLTDNDHMIVVAQDDSNESIVGYIHLQIYKSLYFDNVLNIMGLVVDENMRGKGVGSALLKEAEKIAESLHCKGIRANSGIQREEAHSFYLMNGYSETKMQKRFLKLFKK
jgi:GNAT superfamily N-acetyltransferase